MGCLADPVQRVHISTDVYTLQVVLIYLVVAEVRAFAESQHFSLGLIMTFANTPVIWLAYVLFCSVNPASQWRVEESPYNKSK